MLLHSQDIQKKDTPILSIIMPCYNVGKTLARAFDSVLMQKINYSFEVIFVDDASTDDTLSVAYRYKEVFQSFTIIHNETNNGNAISFYKGLCAAQGKYFCVLDGDDFYTIPGKLQKLDVSKAYLKLNTGEVIELDKYQGMMIREDSVRIANADYTLKYSYDSIVPIEVKYDTLMIPRGSEYSIVLTDGTKVFLNAGSEIYYPVAFSGDRREVGLKGEAYFEVAKDESRPFFVQAGDIRIRVLGTAFNVTSYPERERIETTLEQGRIQITNGKEQIDVVPGEQVVYNKKNNLFEVKFIDTKLYTSWKDGYYKFDQMTLEEIMETLALWYDLNVFYANAEVKSLEFTGRLRRYDRVERLFKKIEQTDLVEFELNGKNVVIRKK